MSFCTVYENFLDTDCHTFEGYIEGDIIFAAVPTSHTLSKLRSRCFAPGKNSLIVRGAPSGAPKYTCDRSGEPWDFAPFGEKDGRILYYLHDFLPAAKHPGDYYKVATFLHNGLYGFVNTENGKIIAGAQFADVQPFIDKRFTCVIYPDGHSGLIDSDGTPMKPCGYNDIYDYCDGIYLAYKRCAKLRLNDRLCTGAVDKDGNIIVPFGGYKLHFGGNAWNGFIAGYDGNHFVFLHKDGTEHGYTYDKCPELHEVNGNYYWLVCRKGKYGIMRHDGTFVFDVTLSHRAAVRFLKEDNCAH